jgi:hypothetical protein
MADAIRTPTGIVVNLDSLQPAANPGDVLRWDGTKWQSDSPDAALPFPLNLPDGSATNPTYSFDPPGNNTGMYHTTMNELGFSAQGSQGLRIAIDKIIFDHPTCLRSIPLLSVPPVISGAEGLLYKLQNDDGLYWRTLAGGDVNLLSSAIAAPLRIADGSSTVPSYSFQSAQQSGLYIDSFTGALSIASNGQKALSFSTQDIIIATGASISSEGTGSAASPLIKLESDGGLFSTMGNLSVAKSGNTISIFGSNYQHMPTAGMVVTENRPVTNLAYAIGDLTSVTGLRKITDGMALVANGVPVANLLAGGLSALQNISMNQNSILGLASNASAYTAVSPLGVGFGTNTAGLYFGNNLLSIISDSKEMLSFDTNIKVSREIEFINSVNRISYDGDIVEFKTSNGQVLFIANNTDLVMSLSSTSGDNINIQSSGNMGLQISEGSRIQRIKNFDLPTTYVEHLYLGSTNPPTLPTITLDGANVSVGDRILYVNMVSASLNGVYRVQSRQVSPPMITVLRDTGFDDLAPSDRFSKNAKFLIGLGNTNAGKLYQTANAPAALGTDPWTFREISSFIPLGSSNTTLLFDTSTSQWESSLTDVTKIHPMLVNSDITLIGSTQYYVDSNGQRILTLPVLTSQNDIIRVVDSTGQAAVNNIQINPNGGDTIDGMSVAATISSNYGVLTLHADSNTGNWIVEKPSSVPAVNDSLGDHKATEALNLNGNNIENLLSYATAWTSPDQLSLSFNNQATSGLVYNNNGIDIVLADASAARITPTQTAFTGNVQVNDAILNTTGQSLAIGTQNITYTNALGTAVLDISGTLGITLATGARTIGLQTADSTSSAYLLSGGVQHRMTNFDFGGIVCEHLNTSTETTSIPLGTLNGNTLVVGDFVLRVNNVTPEANGFYHVVASGIPSTLQRVARFNDLTQRTVGMGAFIKNGGKKFVSTSQPNVVDLDPWNWTEEAVILGGNDGDGLFYDSASSQYNAHRTTALISVQTPILGAGTLQSGRRYIVNNDGYILTLPLGTVIGETIELVMTGDNLLTSPITVRPATGQNIEGTVNMAIYMLGTIITFTYIGTRWIVREDIVRSNSETRSLSVGTNNNGVNSVILSTDTTSIPVSQTVIIGRGAGTSINSISNGNNVIIGAYALAGGSIATPFEIVSIGSGSVVTGNASVTIGSQTVGGDASVTMGFNARSTNNAVSIGFQSNVVGSDGVAVGHESYAGALAVAVGKSARAEGIGSIVIGNNSTTTAERIIILADGVSSNMENGFFVNTGIATMTATPLHYDLTTGRIGPMSSSRRYKTGIIPLEPDSRKITMLVPKTYEMKNQPGIKRIGFIAEDMIKVFPEVVFVNGNGEPESINYDLLTVLIIDWIKNHSGKHRIDELEREKAEQAARIAKLEEQVELLTTMLNDMMSDIEQMTRPS